MINIHFNHNTNVLSNRLYVNPNQFDNYKNYYVFLYPSSIDSESYDEIMERGLICDIQVNGKIPMDHGYVDLPFEREDQDIDMNVLLIYKYQFRKWTTVLFLTNNIEMGSQLDLTFYFKQVLKDSFMKQEDRIPLFTLQHQLIHVPVFCRSAIHFSQEDTLLNRVLTRYGMINDNTTILYTKNVLYPSVSPSISLSINNVQKETKTEDFFVNTISSEQLFNIFDWTFFFSSNQTSEKIIMNTSSILVYGPPGTGKTFAITHYCHQHHIPCLLLNCWEFVMKYGRDAYLGIEEVLHQAIQLQPCVLVLKPLECIFPRITDEMSFEEQDSELLQSDSIIQLNQYIDYLIQQISLHHYKIVLCGLTSNLSIVSSSVTNRFTEKVEFLLPNEEISLQYYQHIFHQFPCSFEESYLNSLVQYTHNYTYRDIYSLFLMALQRQSIDNTEEPSVITKETLQTLLRTFKSEIQILSNYNLSISIPSTTWSSIGGLESVKQLLKEIVVYPIQYKSLYAHYHIQLPTGILLYGPPGTGKTVLVKGLANICGYNFININTSSIMDKQVGSSEKKLKEIFDRAIASSPCILFFDEIQSIFSSRDSTGSSSRQIISQLIIQFDHLSMMNQSFHKEKKNSHVLVIGNTNCPDIIDKSLLRPGRFDKYMYRACLSVDMHSFVDLPNEEERMNILHIYLDLHPTKDIDYSLISQKLEYYSGADIASLCRYCTLDMIDQHKDCITTDMMLSCIERIPPSTNLEEYEKLKNWSF